MTQTAFNEYKLHLASPVLTEEEKNELRGSEGCEDEIEMRFGGGLAFQ